MKAVVRIDAAPPRHWVGDGFPVHAMFGYGEGARSRSPFLMLDYAAPTVFAPVDGAHRRGVGAHPHRGFETVTIVYDGEVAHRDSTGAGGVIGRGDVQWMTAGAGILHDEFHSDAYSARGGPFEMVQLWVNLPAKDKGVRPGYQALADADIPAVALPEGAGTLRVVAGTFDGRHGPASTHTPMSVWDVRLEAGRSATLPVPSGWTTLALVQHGRVRFGGDGPGGAPEAGPAQLVTFARDGDALRADATPDAPARLLLLAGEPIDEPVVGHGPFVMTSQAGIREAIADFHAGRYGRFEAFGPQGGAARAGA